MSLVISIQPVALRRKQLADFFGSEQLARDIIKKGLLKPVLKSGNMSLFDTADATAAYVRFKASEQRMAQ